jgi:hypothetical protein
MHAEVHAEVEFGLDNSIATTSAELQARIAVFEEHRSAWAEVDLDIVAARDEYERVDAPGSAELQRAAKHEVVAWEAIWAGEWQWALDAIRTVLDKLQGERTSKRYAALWNYMAFSIARRLATQSGDANLLKSADTYYQAARVSSRGTSWLAHLHAPSETATVPEPAALDPVDNAAMTAVLAASALAKPATFNAEITRARAALAATEYTAYEAGLVLLGTLAGAKPSYGSGGDVEDAAADAVWIFGEAQWVIWEAKSMAKPTGSLGADNVRQAGAHLRSVEAQRGTAAPGDSVCLLVTPKPSVRDSARNVAEGHVYLVRPSEVLDVFDRLVRAWQTARARGLSTLSVDDAAEIFRAEGALPTEWLPQLRTQPLVARR